MRELCEVSSQTSGDGVAEAPEECWCRAARTDGHGDRPCVGDSEVSVVRSFGLVDAAHQEAMASCGFGDAGRVRGVPRGGDEHEGALREVFFEGRAGFPEDARALHPSFEGLGEGGPHNLHPSTTVMEATGSPMGVGVTPEDERLATRDRERDDKSRAYGQATHEQLKLALTDRTMPLLSSLQALPLKRMTR